MTRIAHLTDTHLDGSAAHRQRFDAVLEKAWGLGAQHLLLTGDLTGHGRPNEFQELANALRGWPAHAVTMVPGNHDGHSRTWQTAIDGPLRAFANTSTPGMFTDIGDAVIVPISTHVGGRAPAFWAIGYVDRASLRMLHEIAGASMVLGKVMVVAMHHGPQLSLLQPLDGLVNRHDMTDLLKSHQHVWLCCGHDHRHLDIGRVFAAASVAEHPDPLRMYETHAGRLIPTYRSEDPGSTLGWLRLRLPSSRT
jgi:3',5'-cyclic AMP phosphodiesterase CpdA